MVSREKNDIISHPGLQCLFLSGRTGATAGISVPPQLNTGITYRSLGAASFASGWDGTISCGYITPGIGMIWGAIRRTSNADPAWGEKVLEIPRLRLSYVYALNAFNTDGDILDTYVLGYDGTIAIYPPDYAKITYGKVYTVWALFFVG